MRTRYSAVNMAVNLAGQAMNLLLAYGSRAVLAYFLSAEYLGLNGLFSNILSILSLTELGIHSAMTYSMYRPAAEGDERKLAELINLYRRLYRIVAAAVTVFGLILLPFLGYLVKDGSQIGMERLQFYYLLFLAQSVSSYFFTYKTSLLFVHQRQYITSLYTQAFTLIRYLLQILLLYLTRNYTLYVAVQIACTILPNYCGSRHAQRQYPWLRKPGRELPPKQERRTIYRNMLAMGFHRLGGILVNNTDSLLMSAFLGLSSVGIYSNYQLVSTHLTRFLNQMITSMAASVGNLNAAEDKERIYRVYRDMTFLGYLGSGYCVVAMAVLFSPFIRLAFGEEFLLPEPVVWLFLAVFYLKSFRQTSLCFRDAMGIFWYDRYKPLAEAAINLAISLWLVPRYGITGILTGTMVSFLLTSFWVDPLVVFRFGMVEEWKKKLKSYYFRYALYAAVLMAAWCAARLLCGPVPENSFFWFAVKGCWVTIVYGVFMSLVFWRLPEFRDLREIGGRLLGKRRKKSGRV